VIESVIAREIHLRRPAGPNAEVRYKALRCACCLEGIEKLEITLHRWWSLPSQSTCSDTSLPQVLTGAVATAVWRDLHRESR
jgi:hypothetical protein